MRTIWLSHAYALFFGLRMLWGLIGWLWGFTYHTPLVAVAGRGGQPGFLNYDSTEQIRATRAPLNHTTGITFGHDGALFIAEEGSNRVLKVGPDHAVITYAGAGTEGFSGDGGRAVRATFDQPYQLAADGKGNLYISDAHNERIRRVDAKGVITTFAGTGVAGYNGDHQKATESSINVPGEMAFDPAGNMYFADIENHRVRKIDTHGIITTVAGTGVAGYSGDGGPAAKAELHYPESVQIDAEGELFITDMANGVVRKIDRKGIISTIAGYRDRGFSGFFRSFLPVWNHGNARKLDLDEPLGLACDTRGNVFFSDRKLNRVFEIHPDGTYDTVLYRIRKPFLFFWKELTYEAANSDTAQFLKEPKALRIDREGNLYIADSGNNVIRMLPHAAAPGLYNGAPFPGQSK